MAIDREGDGPSLRRSEPRRGEGNDLRATPFTDEVFAEERRPQGRGRSFSLVIGLVLGLAVIGGVGWYAFHGQGLAPLPSGEVQTVKADPTPYKVKPENPGGLQVDNQDKLVYDRVAKGSAPKRVETLLPPPEVPKAPPVKKTEAAAPPEVKPPEVKPPEVPKVAEAKPAEPKTVEAKSAEAKSPEPKVPETKPAEVKTAEVKAAPEPAKAENKPDTQAPTATADQKAMQAAVKSVTDQPKAPADPLAAAVAAATGTAPKPAAPIVEARAEPAASAAPATAPVAAAIPNGAFQVQLASVPSEEAAQSEWKRMSGRNKDLASMIPAITKADLGEKGIYYRLRVGPLADKAAADALCGALAADKIGCIVIKP